VDLLTLDETITVTGLPARTLFRVRERGEFPPAVSIGPTGRRRCVYFRTDEVSAWCAAHGIQAKPRVQPVS
jgi:predicted DNA-binding transcriptional regulator AlpA